MMTHKKGRLILSLLGISLSVIIMFMETGFFNGINDSQANLPPLLNADLVIMHDRRYSMLEINTVPRDRLQQALAFEEINEAVPLYEGVSTVLNVQNGRLRKIYILAFPPEKDALLVPGVEKYRDALKITRNVLFDRLSRKIYGDIKPGKDILLGGIPHKIVGEVEIGPSIAWDGYLVMGDVTWFSIGGDPDRINLGLLHAREGTDLKALKEKLMKRLPTPGLMIMTPEEMRKREVIFTIRSTPTGSVFGIGVAVGFLIGVIICYQILFNEITDNMPQYATMKAMGFSKYFLVKLVLKQALLLSLLGFIPGLIGGVILYAGIQYYTRILMFMTFERVALLFLLTIFMCIFAGLFAVKKVLKADPADLY